MWMILGLILTLFLVQNCIVDTNEGFKAKAKAEQKQEQINHEKELQKQGTEKTLKFFQDYYPELYSKYIEIKSAKHHAQQEINKKQKLISEFPKQKNIILPTINKWKQVNGTLSRVSSEIIDKIEKVYVSVELNNTKAEYFSEETGKDLLDRANKALSFARQN